jgi:hypothetical protein
MTLRKIERDQRMAELSSVEAIIARLTDEDFLTRIGLESRRDELQAWLAEQEAEPEEESASAALFFSGTPVAQTRGIEAKFGSLAVNKFQDLVAMMMAQEDKPLAVSGPIPNRSASTLHITNVTRGSFGFLLEEIEPQGQVANTSLKVAVDSTTRLLAALGSGDEDHFREVAETVDQRALNTAHEFFSLVRGHGARFRIVAGVAEQSFSDSAMILATERASTTRVMHVEELLEGQFGGALPEAHLFELRAAHGTISGNVSADIPASELTIWNRELVNRSVRAALRVRRVYRNGLLARESYTLLRLESEPGPIAGLLDVEIP